MSKELNIIKDEIQKQAHAIWVAAGCRGTIAAGTGFGKSRVAIMECERLSKDTWIPADEPADILLVTPTEKLRDENWPNEFKDWEASWILSARIKCICFASLKKELGNKYKLVILDEIHRLTDLSAAAFQTTGEDVLTKFMSESLSESVMGLTATVPNAKRDPDKVRIISQIAPVVFSYSLDQGVEDGMIRDYEIRVITSELDKVNKTVRAGTKTKPFFVTEEYQYDYLEKSIRGLRAQAYHAKSPADKKRIEQLIMFKTMERNRFIYNLPSKTALALKCIQYIQSDKRTLVFCGSIDQCNYLFAEKAHHSKNKKGTAYDDFNSKKINIMGVVDSLNEGANLVNLDQSLVIQVNSNERNLVQRVGRNLRLGLEGKAIIYILCVLGTADERWLKKALEGFDKGKIIYYSSKNII